MRAELVVEPDEKLATVRYRTGTVPYFDLPKNNST